MSKQNPSDPNVKRGIIAPDTATTYERAKPAEQSPGGSLKQSPPPKTDEPDELQKNEAPSSVKKS